MTGFLFIFTRRTIARDAISEGYQQNKSQHRNHNHEDEKPGYKKK